jgi:2-oxoglutarate dehydrogenase E2 component (dihydrolipoamide succinyltransferase)
MFELKVPSVGESITEGRLGRWFKPSGAYIKVDEPVFELETDKAAQEVVAPVSGLLQILIPEGEKVEIGQLVARIDTSAAVPANAAPSVPKPAVKAEEKSEVILSPAARRIVEENQLDPAKILATGPGGRVTKEDALNASSKPAPKPEAKSEPAPAPKRAAGPRSETRQKMSFIRTKIAERLLFSQQSTATLTTFNEVDMSVVMDLRAKYKDRFKEKQGVNLGFMSFFVKASIEALKAFPLVNARIDGDEIVHQHFYDIGVAVSTEKGLMVPILRDCDQMNFAQIEKKIGELAIKARDGKIGVTDLQGGTFTITNGGIFGSMLSTPILNPPQTAILGMHAIQKRAMVVNDAIVIRPMMYLALSYDHRLIDGREAVQFLVRIKECLENPERMLLEI